MRAHSFRAIKTEPGQLLAEHSEHFSQISRPCHQDVLRLRELFYSMVYDTTPEQRSRIARALSRSEYTPRAIAVFLAMEEIEVGEPMLLFSPVLEAHDLDAIVEKTSEFHAEIIARRSDLADHTIERLLTKDTNSALVRQALAGNPSLRGRLSTIQAKMLHAQHTPTITESAPSTKQIKAHEQAPQIRNKPYELDHETRDANQELLALASRGGKLGAQSAPREQAPAMQTRLPEFSEELVVAVREHRLDDFANQIQQICGLDISITQNFISEQNAGSLACLFRALHMPKTKAARLMLLLVPKAARSASVFSKVMEKYEHLDLQRAVAFLKMLDPQFGLQTETPPNSQNEVGLSRLLANRASSIRTAAASKQEAEDIRRVS